MARGSGEQTGTQEIPFKHEKKNCYCEDSRALEQVAQRYYGVSIPEILKTWLNTAVTLTDPALIKRVRLDGFQGFLPNWAILYLDDMSSWFDFGPALWLVCQSLGWFPKLAYHHQTCSTCFIVALVGKGITPCLMSPSVPRSPCVAAGPCYSLSCCSFLNEKQQVG